MSQRILINDVVVGILIFFAACSTVFSMRLTTNIHTFENMIKRVGVWSLVTQNTHFHVTALL